MDFVVTSDAKMKKQYYFLLGLPRAGNTLLGSLINQNSNVCLTAYSVLPETLWQLELLKQQEPFLNFPDRKSFDNVTKNVVKNYYSKYTANKIIDRGHWGTPANLKQVKKNVTKNPKFIILYRPVVECLASFVKIGEPARDKALLERYLDDNSFMGMAKMAIKNIIIQKEDYIFVTYKDLTTKPIDTVKKIFKFIEEDYNPIQTTNLKQMQINNITYDDSVLAYKAHTIKTNLIKHEEIKVDNYLSKWVIEEAIKFDTIMDYV